ncbi:hypothetical protein [Sodalis ligni]|uniref:Uncharacterized protein n=1 Tax=Sodalis ligni TaxID=2697027 RepID=A0A4R1NR21_9GAMM|nr:hypothetical protein [Sodalis ligni]TCL06850.1 hypothetical protein EZJ58_5147 [Sodalis ligni]
MGKQKLIEYTRSMLEGMVVIADKMQWIGLTEQNSNKIAVYRTALAALTAEADGFVRSTGKTITASALNHHVSPGDHDFYLTPPAASLVPDEWRSILCEMVDAMHQYEMDIDSNEYSIASAKHRDMMRRVKALLAAAPSPASVTQATLTNQRIEPMEPQRDENGWWSHPDYIPDLEEDALRVEFDVWLEVNGVECVARLMEDDLEPGSPEAVAWESLDCDCSVWNPQPPEGDGWFLVSVHDTEEGPSAVWLRKLSDVQPITPYDALMRFYRELHDEHKKLVGKAQRLRYRCENLDGQLKELKAARWTPTTPAMPDNFESWFIGIESDEDGNFTEPRYLSDEWHAYIARRQLALGAWNACRASMLAKQPVIAVPDSAAIRDVIAERQRQITAEGWTPEHDDRHENGELAAAAGEYALHAALAPWDEDIEYTDNPHLNFWPWEESWWKPTNPRRDLIKAGALIIAEIERLDRAEDKNNG